MRFGDVVKERRMELNMTQDEVASVSGTSQQMLTQIERYGVEPKFSLGCKIIIALDMSPMDVYDQISVS